MNQATKTPVTAMLAEHASKNRNPDDAQTELLALARLTLMDVSGVAIAARKEPLVRSLIEVYTNLGSTGKCSVLSHPLSLDPLAAATVNGSMNHALDFDDTLPQFLGHPSAVLWGALLPLAQLRSINPRKALDAYLVGLEVGSLLVQFLGPAHYTAGWHGTATIGRNAAAAACAHLLGLNAEQTRHALAIAATTSGGSKASFGTMCKPFHAGNAASGGVQAALLAEAGFTGSEGVYENRLGIGDLMAGERGLVSAASFATEHPISALTFKYHAACHCTHGAIDIALDALREHDFSPADIAGIRVYFSQISLDNANITDPKTGLDGKFSTTYALASALLNNNTGVGNFTDEKVRDPATREFMQRIEVIVDDAHREQGLLTTCEITLKDGSVYADSLDPSKVPLSYADKLAGVQRKFDGLVAPVLGVALAADLRGAIESFDTLSSVDEFFSLTCTGDKPE